MSKNKKRKKNDSDNTKKTYCDTPSSTPVLSDPQTVFELINKYGTYNIQPTGATENAFPKIAQGLPQEENRQDAGE